VSRLTRAFVTLSSHPSEDRSYATSTVPPIHARIRSATPPKRQYTGSVARVLEWDFLGLWWCEGDLIGIGAAVAH